jgi:hypothetical protein
MQSYETVSSGTFRMGRELARPLFVCHANCCRSVMAEYLYRDLAGATARAHRPQRIDRELCDDANAILAMGPAYLARILDRLGRDLAPKSYLFADPFVLPEGFEGDAFLVYDPSFDLRKPADLVHEFEWFSRRVAGIHQALVSGLPVLVPASRYLDRLDAIRLGTRSDVSSLKGMGA